MRAALTRGRRHRTLGRRVGDECGVPPYWPPMVCRPDAVRGSPVPQGTGLRVSRADFRYGWTHMNELARLVQSGPRVGYSPGASRMVSPVNSGSLKKSQVPDATLTDAI